MTMPTPDKYGNVSYGLRLSVHDAAGFGLQTTIEDQDVRITVFIDERFLQELAEQASNPATSDCELNFSLDDLLAAFMRDYGTLPAYSSIERRPADTFSNELRRIADAIDLIERD